MCLILLAWQCHPDYPLVVAANRDEFHRRRSTAVDFWPEHPQILAGRDLAAGGTWLGLSRNGRFAALTNFRDPASHRDDAPSRGQLVADFLKGDDDIDAYLDSLQPGDYNGFNLLLGNGEKMVAFSNTAPERHDLAPGIYGLSNALLDTPWPKVDAGKTALRTALNCLPGETLLRQLLCNTMTHPDETLPATGVSLAWERLLSAAFICSPDYGTRCSTILKINSDGMASFDEQTWLPSGQSGERHRFCWRLAVGRAFQPTIATGV